MWCREVQAWDGAQADTINNSIMQTYSWTKQTLGVTKSTKKQYLTYMEGTKYCKFICNIELETMKKRTKM